jgi:hypothetical protein
LQAADSSGSYGGYGKQGLTWSLHRFLHLIEAAQAACTQPKTVHVMMERCLMFWDSIIHSRSAHPHSAVGDGFSCHQQLSQTPLTKFVHYHITEHCHWLLFDHLRRLGCFSGWMGNICFPHRPCAAAGGGSYGGSSSTNTGRHRRSLLQEADSSGGYGGYGEH